ncbi:MAG: hypothetical protein M1813_003424 [Trichoglossum hirsutum]|nr:MAG: hypothetical protein M1813_003424 [Trichoglossum hirsutum]
MFAQHPLHVIILGAGVIGLQTAVFLLEAGYKVTIVAKNLPGDLDVDAGAHWRTHATADEPELIQWDKETFEHWLSLVAEEGASKRDGLEVGESGLKLYPVFYYWDSPNQEISQGVQSIWWRNVVLDFKVLDPCALPKGVYFGVTYSSFCINPPTYLSYLMRQIETSGGSVRRLTVPARGGLSTALAAVADEVGVESPYAIVNATGLGAIALGDENMFPTKGQTVLVRNESPVARIRVGDGYVTYTIPRPGGGGTILGGSNQVDNWDPQVDPELSKEITGRCRELAPDLLNSNGEFEVVSEQVGFRPSRSGGPRVELERVLSVGREKPFVIVHCYGHSGAG